MVLLREIENGPRARVVFPAETDCPTNRPARVVLICAVSCPLACAGSHDGPIGQHYRSTVSLRVCTASLVTSRYT